MSQNDKLTILAKDAAAQKGCPRGECHAFIVRVTRTCVEVIRELGGSLLCDIADVIGSSTTPTTEDGLEMENQMDKEGDINHSMVPDQDIEAGPQLEKQSESQDGHKQAKRTIPSSSLGKRKMSRSVPR